MFPSEKFALAVMMGTGEIEALLPAGLCSKKAKPEAPKREEGGGQRGAEGAGANRNQIIVMCIVSIIGTIFCRKFLQKHFEVNKEVKASTIDAMAGKSGLVIKTITKDNIGLVKVEGEIWSATSIDNDSIEEGTDITVEYIDGVKLIVKKYN